MYNVILWVMCLWRGRCLRLYRPSSGICTFVTDFPNYKCFIIALNLTKPLLSINNDYISLSILKVLRCCYQSLSKCIQCICWCSQSAEPQGEMWKQRVYWVAGVGWRSQVPPEWAGPGCLLVVDKLTLFDVAIVHCTHLCHLSSHPEGRVCFM